MHDLLGNVCTKLLDVAALGNQGRCSYGFSDVVGMDAKTGCPATLPCSQHLASYILFCLDTNQNSRGAQVGSTAFPTTPI
jgi:hypothetical protein